MSLTHQFVTTFASGIIVGLCLPTIVIWIFTR